MRWSVVYFAGAVKLHLATKNLEEISDSAKIQKMKKIILIILDGLADKPIKELGGKTPLEAADTPNLDWLASNGTCGSASSFKPKGSMPTSEDSHLAIFGYSPLKYNFGRGVFETAGIGMSVKPGDVCLRGNFATVDNNGIIIDRRAGRLSNTRELIKTISGIKIAGIKFFVASALSYRLGIVMRGKGLSPKISENNHKQIGVKPLAILPEGKSRRAVFTAQILNQFLEICHIRLASHPFNEKRKNPANYILVRGAGNLRESLPNFNKKYSLKSCCIAAGTLYKGIAKSLGMDLIEVKGATGDSKTNLKGKIAAVKKSLNKYSFIFCHIKAADILAEDGRFREKKEFIEKVDKSLKPLLSLKNVAIIVTGDHGTCSKEKRHCEIASPVLVYVSGRNKSLTDSTIKKFSEKNCSLGKMKT
ncbi:MAG: 2,3-bisphosphoglycerate-independent phosphoglycerate mutase, partial [bacterium]